MLKGLYPVRNDVQDFASFLQTKICKNLVKILHICLEMVLFLQDIYKILANLAKIIKILQGKFQSCKNFTSCLENGPFCARLLQVLARHFYLGSIPMRLVVAMLLVLHG